LRSLYFAGLHVGLPWTEGELLHGSGAGARSAGSRIVNRTCPCPQRQGTGAVVAQEMLLDHTSIGLAERCRQREGQSA